ncbi:MAG: biosynthetic-type acetolactate synthase large subunit, partial [Austwickia sp.]|nr:biosynthetic-type acetolactate synthase large subunit [Austwickia sp.]
MSSHAKVVTAVKDRKPPSAGREPRPPAAPTGPAAPKAPTPGDLAARKATPVVEHVTGAQSLVRSLEEVGCEVVFGLPGGAILPAYDPLMDSTRVRHVLVRHEQGAGHAAQGYATATGKVGVCMATSGPGATNLVTPIADAHMDSVPLVAITGQVGSAAIGTDAFQEADIRGITMPITKHNYLITDPDRIPQAIAEAFHIASTGRPGPVLVDITKDALQSQTTFSWPPKMELPGYRPTTRPHGKQIREAARLIRQSRRPVLYVGGGVIKARATDELRALLDLTQIPLVTTLMARGAVPDDHPLHYGMPGMHGSVSAVTALQRSDLLIALGSRFDDRVTGKLATFAPLAKVIHADIDPAEIGKNREADVPIVGDCQEVIAALIEELTGPDSEGIGDYADWVAEMTQVRQTYPLGYTEPDSGAMSPQYVIERIGAIAGPEATYVAGVGQHQMWAAQFVRYSRPNSWLNSGGLGTMGFSIPAAIGAKVGRPDRMVWAVD